jgi:hypothetical protein
MPTLFRLLTKLAILVVLAYAVMYALATFVTPRQTEIVVPIPPERLDRR